MNRKSEFTILRTKLYVSFGIGPNTRENIAEKIVCFKDETGYKIFYKSE